MKDIEENYLSEVIESIVSNYNVVFQESIDDVICVQRFYASLYPDMNNVSLMSIAKENRGISNPIFLEKWITVVSNLEKLVQSQEVRFTDKNFKTITAELLNKVTTVKEMNHILSLGGLKPSDHPELLESCLSKIFTKCKDHIQLHQLWQDYKTLFVIAKDSVCRHFLTKNVKKLIFTFPPKNVRLWLLTESSKELRSNTDTYLCDSCRMSMNNKNDVLKIGTPTPLEVFEYLIK